MMRAMKPLEPAPIDILVIDDDVSVRDMLLQLLRGAGYSGHAASDGRRAMQMLQERGYRLVVTDVFMPEADGLEVLLSAGKSMIPVITMSGSPAFDPTLFKRVARHFGARYCFTKPFNFEEMLVAIREEIGAPRDG